MGGSSWQLVWVELAVGVGQTGSWCGAKWQLVWGKLAVAVGQTGVGTVGKFKFKSSLLTVLLFGLDNPAPPLSKSLFLLLILRVPVLFPLNFYRST